MKRILPWRLMCWPPLLWLLCWQPAAAQGPADSTLKRLRLVNLVVGIYDRGHISTAGFGGIVAVSDVVPDGNTPYEIASITKTFTAYLLARAVIDGKLRLSDPVTSYLHGSFPGLAGVTLLQLANHTAGLPKFLPPLDRSALRTPADAASYPVITPAAFLAALRQFHPDTLPGTRYEYSNAGIQLLGLVLEKVYHRTYAQLLKKYITEPLHMHHTGLDVPDSVAGAGQYDENERPMPYMHFWDELPAAGSIKSTAADMALYLRLCLDKLDPAVRLCETVTFRQTGEHGADIGLCWYVRHSATGELEVLHGGGSLGSTSMCLLLPERGIGVVCLAGNAGPGIEDALLQLAERKALALIPGGRPLTPGAGPLTPTAGSSPGSPGRP
ncbi:MAG TPA: serine hydrolase domain-containing protein [Dinghuibacter sp.]|uniref:serine hydrolase domain-containing protein n=1 Tax=Dinghuibacter sp. TaxID=2024697 RepID=UPI002C761E49|nr:serine hydrolase domain-containing protein [Dinghuibacter sp.]HTJ14087.1 serine hydrolase domain-containing protein [Dinghuibacter sp.]